MDNQPPRRPDKPGFPLRSNKRMGYWKQNKHKEDYIALSLSIPASHFKTIFTYYNSSLKLFRHVSRLFSNKCLSYKNNNLSREDNMLRHIKYFLFSIFILLPLTVSAEDLPCEIKTNAKIVAFGDVHGAFDELTKYTIGRKLPLFNY